MLYFPRIELRRFKRIEFFPPHPGDLSRIEALCLGSKTRTIGDAMMLSTLPGKLRALQPKLRITTYPRGFNPVVFHGNPHVCGVSYLPDAVYGDDNNEGCGQLIQLKERFFGVPVSEPPRPELYLTTDERATAAALLARGGESEDGRALLILHPWGHTWKKVLSLETWTRLVSRWQSRFRTWQVGIEGHARIPGCERHFLTPRGFRHARRLFALLAHARAFIGVNSGPMHIAKAFAVPSLILTEQGGLAEIFRRRRESPYFLHGNWAHSFLYEDNLHLDVPALGEPGTLGEIDRFLEPLSRTSVDSSAPVAPDRR